MGVGRNLLQVTDLLLFIRQLGIANLGMIMGLSLLQGASQIPGRVIAERIMNMNCILSRTGIRDMFLFLIAGIGMNMFFLSANIIHGPSLQRKKSSKKDCC